MIDKRPASAHRAKFSRRGALAALVMAMTVSVLPTAQASDLSVRTTTAAKPTVVLVHGAWADSSSWDGVVHILQSHGYTVDVFPTPLRSLTDDADYLRSYLAAIPGPIVLVGHSYGGAVVSAAATGNAAVKALVYVDAFAPEQGEAVLQLAGATSALANPDPTQVFRFVPNTLPPTATTDLVVLPSVFPKTFANDLPLWQAKVLAVSQRPVTFGALNEPSPVPAWKTIPSWYEVGTLDKVIPASQQIMMAQRAGSHIVRVASSHLPMVSHPDAVGRLIERAATETR